MTLTECELFMLAFHGICIALFLITLIRAILLDRFEIRTHGKVTFIKIVENESDMGTNNSYKTLISYTDQHKASHTLKVKLASRHKVAVGDEVAIVYSRNKPSRSMLDKKIYIYLFPPRDGIDLCNVWGHPGADRVLQPEWWVIGPCVPFLTEAVLDDIYHFFA